MDITPISRHTDLLDQVKALWKSNRNTLGPFPMGAFDEYAQKDTILIALDSGRCLGYLLYREVPARNEIALTHLCVDPQARGNGVARSLVDALKLRTAPRRGIGLWCRRDYSATQMWPRFGFVYRKERPGRGSGAATLNYWWLDHGHPDLLTVANRQDDDTRPTVALDASVFFSFISENRADDDEIAAMQSDWVVPEVRYSVTTELLNEIGRCQNPNDRDRQLKLAHKLFLELPTNDSEFSRILDALDNSLGRAADQSVASDRRQLARAASGGADFFITQDQELLSVALDHRALLSLPVLRPAEFITRIDSLVRDTEYRPVALRGSCYISNPGPSIKIREMQDCFINHEAGETRQAFQSTLKDLLTHPKHSVLRVIRDRENTPIGLLGIDLRNPSFASLRVCRVSKGRDAKTLACQLLEEAILESNKRGINLCVIDDDNASLEVAEMQNEMGFMLAGGKPLKLSIRGTAKRQDASGIIRERTASIGQILPNLTDYVQKIQGALSDYNNPLAGVQAEKLLRPLKIEDLSLPCYIVPIEAAWASQLFDDELAARDLFGAKPELMFRRTNAYYRSARQCGIAAPGRILWYVKKSAGHMGTKAIRGYSYLDEVIIDSAKSVFSQFRRFGIYGWKDVLALTDGRPNDQVMALLFSYSERFDKPVHFEDVQNTLKHWDMPRNQFQSPLRIPEGAFIDIYSEGAL